jgi:predicted GH43/DUF377 family glycosyl hydrolase
MHWEKQGLIFAPNGEMPWAQSAAHLPTADVLDESIRIYFAARDANGYGRIGCVDLDIDNPHRILAVQPKPVLDLGELGAFDDCGVVPNSIAAFSGRKYLYYQGYQRTERVPYLTFTGLAIGDSEGKNFEKWSRTPITDRTDKEPFIRSGSCVLHENLIWKMWYVSTVKWTQDEHGLHYVCVIRYATSSDGIGWTTHDSICLEPKLPDEYAVGRPAVVYDGRQYRMWYSIRSFSQLYTIGYAESTDGLVWVRKDEQAGIGKSESGWDSEMICYPNVVHARGRTLMFYNGNGLGMSGFGYAVLES